MLLPLVIAVTGLLAIQPEVRAASAGIPAQLTDEREASKKFSTGWAHACVLRDDGFPVCWGGDSNSGINGLSGAQVIGDSPSDMGGALTRMIPRKTTGAPTPVRVSQVVAGGGYTCLVDVEGAVRCWGINGDGQLGIGTTLDASQPATPIPLGNVAVEEIIVGGQHRENNNNHHLCARLVNGTLKCWGNNSAGQLGLGTVSSPNDKIGDQSGEIAALQPIDLGAGVTVSAVAAGFNYSCVIASGGTRNLPSGSVLCWGENGLGQLGKGSITGANAKIGDAPGEMGEALLPVNLGAGRSAVAISAGSSGPCVLRDNASVICWGGNYDGEVGQDQSSTVKIGDAADEVAGLTPMNFGLSAGESVTQIASGFRHHCVATNNNRVKCWGSNGNGQLGQGNTTSYGTNTNPISGLSWIDLNLSAGENISVLSLAGRYSCVYTSLAAVKCWGRNNGSTYGSGTLGIGTITAPDDNIGDGAGELGTALRAVNYTASTPEEPTNLVGTGSSGSFSISFTPPAPTYGAITGYDHQCRLMPSGSQFTPVGFAGSPLTLSTVNSTAVVNGSTYRCGIRALTANGPGVQTFVDVVAGNSLTVTASSSTIDLGSPVPTITGTPSVNGVGRSGETCSTTYTISSSVGTYPTTCSGGTAAGYGITYVAGVITVVHPAPTVVSVSPVSGPAVASTNMTITGTGFLAGATVSVGGASCTSVVVVSSTSITCTSPARPSGAANIVVTNTDTRSSTGVGLFTYIPAPTVSAISPTSGDVAGLQNVTITGTGFAAGATVRIGTSACTGVSVVSSTSITCQTSSQSAGSGLTVRVTNSDSQFGELVSGYSYTTTTTTTTTTTVVPTAPTTAPVVSVAVNSTGSRLVNASNQAALTATPGKASVLVNGVPVVPQIVTASNSAAAQANPAERSPEQVRELQQAAATMETRLDTIAGGDSGVSVVRTETGAVMTGIFSGTRVPVEDVVVVNAANTATLFAARDVRGNIVEVKPGAVLEVASNGDVAVQAFGLRAGETVELVVMSTPTLLGSFTVDAKGTIKTTAKLPTSIGSGNHSLVVASPTVKASLGLKLVKSSASLPVTGSNTNTASNWAVAVMLSGMYLVLVGRRRRQMM